MNVVLPSTSIAFKLKGSLFTCSVLTLFTIELNLIRHYLAELIQKTPNFFQNIPVILDLQQLPPPTAGSLDLKSLIAALRTDSLIPVGIRGGTLGNQKEALSLGIAILPLNKAETSASETFSKPLSSAPTKIVNTPIRSGQQIYAKSSDLIILTSVSSGAEVLADGNIHIYGRLAGRALAGAKGNTQTHIFCNLLEAELVAIAGHYWVSEDIQKNPFKEHVDIYLRDDQLQIKKSQ